MLIQKKNQQNKSSQTGDRALKDWLIGTDDFIECVKKYGCNERGEPIKLSPWYEEYLKLIADWRIGRVFTSGCSQLGKTLGHTLLLCYCLTELGMNTIWSYDQERSLQIQVKSNFRPVIDAWLQRKGQKPTKEDAQSNTLYQVNNVTSQFVYVSTSKPGNMSGTAAAGGIAVGVSRDVLFKEERSQYPPGASDPLNRRLDAGRIPTRPIRELGTPGAGAGIEAEIKKCDRQFYPHYKCPHCGIIAPLHPKGCLLRETEFLKDGQVVKRYLSEYGKPIDNTGWFYKDANDQIGTAYIGCSRCGGELDAETRSQSWFQCTRTGEKLTDFLTKLPNGVPDRSWSCGLVISPLLRTGSAIASRIIQEGRDTVNTADWQQQGLGEESTVGTNLLFNLDYAKSRAIGVWSEPRSQHRYLVGIDPNFGGDDFFVCLVWDITKKPYELVAQYRKKGMSSDYNERESIVLLKKYKPVICAIENNSGGAIIAENLIKQMSSQRFETVTTSGKSKIINTDRLVSAIEHAEIIYPATWEFISEWVDHTGKPQPSEASQFDRKSREAIAGHDDTIMAWAAAFAWLDSAIADSRPRHMPSAGNKLANPFA